MSALTYGPHQEPETPATVTVRVGKYARETEAPIHPGLVEQRRLINTRAAGTLRRIADRSPA